MYTRVSSTLSVTIKLVELFTYECLTLFTSLLYIISIYSRFSFPWTGTELLDLFRKNLTLMFHKVWLFVVYVSDTSPSLISFNIFDPLPVKLTWSLLLLSTIGPWFGEVDGYSSFSGVFLFSISNLFLSLYIIVLFLRLLHSLIGVFLPGK